MAAWKRGKGQEVGFGVGEHYGDFRVGPGEHGGDFGELPLNVFRIGLGKDGADDGGHHFLGSLRHDREDISHKVDPAALPAGTLEHSTDGFL